MRKIKRIHYAHQVDMGGFPVRQPLPSAQVNMLDPFLLLHHATIKVRAGTDHTSAGVGPHPHRGFSPVSVAFRGEVHHRDSLGNDSIIGAGGVQWINSGSGIIHSERPSKKLCAEGGLMEFIQLWVNTPASAKMDGASYQPFTREEAGEVQFEGGHGVIYSGELNGIAGPVQTHTNVVVARIDVEEGGKVAFDLPGELISCIYVVSGSINVGEERVDMHNLIELEEGPETIELLGNEASELLLMAGEPLKEPMVNYGPFVMNSNQELSEAVLDYQAGKMGTLEEKFD